VGVGVGVGVDVGVNDGVGAIEYTGVNVYGPAAANIAI
jgi:hypothetical protein